MFFLFTSLHQQNSKTEKLDSSNYINLIYLIYFERVETKEKQKVK